MVRYIARLARRIATSVERRGIRGTWGRVGLKVAWYLPAARRARAEMHEAELEFDRRHCVETAGHVPVTRMRVASPNWAYGVDYYPIDAEEFGEMMEEVGVDFRGFTFVDFGAGKGRAVLLAAEYPFARVIGVEWSEELVAVARRNVGTYVGRPRRCEAIELRCGDAAEFEIPDGPVVLYFYNPFQGEVMAAVVENVRRSMEAERREVIVIYHTPDFDDVWAGAPGLKRVVSGRGYSIYRSVGAAAAV